MAAKALSGSNPPRNALARIPCAFCGEDRPASRPWAQYCSAACRGKAYRAKRQADILYHLNVLEVQMGRELATLRSLAESHPRKAPHVG
jgi:hypothetical protein